ncbi:hypothetical protein TrVE_jg5223 [Triparma verrucosa]|uniref:monogalactosyldiacylglycerol synthase n=1 Tax=Triparma verrucosa TaxID=1606542 RepID=A0A9W6ZCG7_9STRA|nr:hypothetical protein TrVE_jg5223 [Triparma verrucosa]
MHFSNPIRSRRMTYDITLRTLLLAILACIFNVHGLSVPGPPSTPSPPSQTPITPPTLNPPSPTKVPHIIFLSADTGGGHRASALSLNASLTAHHLSTPFTSEIVNIWPGGAWPYRDLVEAYVHLSRHPRQWKFLYHLSNTTPYLAWMNADTVLRNIKRIRKMSCWTEADIIVSVHPTMTNIPQIVSRKPFYTVITDLGSCHATWFSRRCSRMFVASDKLYNKARKRGWVRTEKLVRSGLPIRPVFGEEGERMGGRYSEQGVKYRKEKKEKLGLEGDSVLFMGGGEGVGMEEYVWGVKRQMEAEGVKSQIVVVCGRNKDLHERLSNSTPPPPKRNILKRILRRPKVECEPEKGGSVEIIPLEFIDNPQEYMVACDVLVTKAGPGTIAEAASLGIPLMLTSFLPGQESGNVDIVLEASFGNFSTSVPEVSELVTNLMRDGGLRAEMSRNGEKIGDARAGERIAEVIWEDYWKGRTGRDFGKRRRWFREAWRRMRGLEDDS